MLGPVDNDGGRVPVVSAFTPPRDGQHAGSRGGLAAEHAGMVPRLLAVAATASTRIYSAAPESVVCLAAYF